MAVGVAGADRDEGDRGADGGEQRGTAGLREPWCGTLSTAAASGAPEETSACSPAASMSRRAAPRRDRNRCAGRERVIAAAVGSGQRRERGAAQRQGPAAAPRPSARGGEAARAPRPSAGVIGVVVRDDGRRRSRRRGSTGIGGQPLPASSRYGPRRRHRPARSGVRPLPPDRVALADVEHGSRASRPSAGAAPAECRQRAEDAEGGQRRWPATARAAAACHAVQAPAERQRDT